MNFTIASIFSITLVSAGVLAELNLLRLFMKDWQDGRRRHTRRRLRPAPTGRSETARLGGLSPRRRLIGAALMCGAMPSLAIAQVVATPPTEPPTPLTPAPAAAGSVATPTASPSTADQSSALPGAEAGTGSAISVQFNLDFTNAYFYRGIIQQDKGLIVQPAARLTTRLAESDSLKLDGFVGTWNSLGPNGGARTDDLVTDWYECDLFAGITATCGKLSFTTSYTFLTSPSDAFKSVQELGFTVALDDSEWLKPWSLRPYATIAIETGASASDGADSDTGVYLELGIAPGFSFDLGKTPVTLTFPVSVGLSLSDYYQDAAGNDETFGFVQVGAKSSIPLGEPGRFGAWTLNAGVSVLLLGDHTQAYNSGDDAEIIGTIGLQWNF